MSITDDSSDEYEEDISFQSVDPSWFVSPVERVQTSGGTAPFFRLALTDKGLKAQSSRRIRKDIAIDRNYWIGKDLSHAEDEKDFYKELLRIRSEYDERDVGGNISRDLSEGIGLLEPFMFDYLGVLETKTTEWMDEGKRKLLVMRNLRNDCDKYRMLDLKIGERTACGGWKGKSTLSAMKHVVMDGFTNSATEGYRLCGFNGCPAVIKSMDPLLDILRPSCINSAAISKKGCGPTTVDDDEDAGGSAKFLTYSGRRSIVETMLLNARNGDMGSSPLKEERNLFDSIAERRKSFVTTTFGVKIKNAQVKQVERLMFKRLNGTNAFRFFFDLHMDDKRSGRTEHFLPAEVSEIVAHELVSQLIALSTACHKVKIPQKWIGSSVAVAFDAGLFPNRASQDGDDDRREAEIRSKVICRIFDWGRSELLTADMHDRLSPEEKKDRDHFWELYKSGVDRLSYNATRYYYNQFTASTPWTEVTIEVTDFDSLGGDDYVGKIVIPLPDPSNTEAVEALSKSTSYRLKGILTAPFKSTLYCSVTWQEFPSNSRLQGAWRVTIERASDLPPMDIFSRFSKNCDAYCTVTATNDVVACGRQFLQRTCIIARDRDPEWHETIDIPVCRTTGHSTLKSAFVESGISSIGDKDMMNWFKWDSHHPCRETMTWWTTAMKGKDMSKYGEGTRKWTDKFNETIKFADTTPFKDFANNFDNHKQENERPFDWDKFKMDKANNPFRVRKQNNPFQMGKFSNPFPIDKIVIDKIGVFRTKSPTKEVDETEGQDGRSLFKWRA